jgi:hypothetical protein
MSISLYHCKGKDTSYFDFYSFKPDSSERTDEFNKSLPMSKEDFQELFDYLDSEFSTKKCDHTNNLTKEYLSKKGTENIENILNWMAGHGGYCDCEILANIEDLFEE